VSRLTLVRHAEPAVVGVCYGALDVDLSPRGRGQAAALAERLRKERFDAVVSSPRTRATETAAALGLPIATDDRLRELDFGEFEGRTYDEIAHSHPDVYRAWMETPTRVRFPGGESYGDLRARATEALTELRNAYESVLVVTHGGVIRAALATWLELPEHAIFRLDQRYCGVTVVDWLTDEPVVRILNG
jgi:alpha-ribazole phosphatase